MIFMTAMKTLSWIELDQVSVKETCLTGGSSHEKNNSIHAKRKHFYLQSC